MKAKEFDIKKRDPNWRAMQDIRRSGAGGQHTDKKKAAKQGQVKHKSRMAEDADELYGLRIGDTVTAKIDGQRVQGDIIDIFPDDMEVELFLRGPETGRTVVVDVRDTEIVEATGDEKFDTMMRTIKKGTKKQATADRREREAESRRRAKDAFGPSPADKLSIRPDKDVAESLTTEKQILTRIRQIMYDRKLSGTESNAGELLRLKQQLKDLRNQQGVAEGSGLMASREYKILENELDQYQAILKKSREITKSIKYSRVHSEIITEIKMLAEQNKISPEMFDDAISEIFDAASRLESAVYGLEQPIEDQIRNIKNRILELEDEEYYKESNEQQSSCPECGGPLVSESSLSEKQDACYHKVKSRYKVWPSAYASGALVQCRKKGAKNWGNKSK